MKISAAQVKGRRPNDAGGEMVEWMGMRMRSSLLQASGWSQACAQSISLR